MPERPTLRQGDEGDDVFLLQIALGLAGIPPGKVDGMFGPSTALAVRSFQLGRQLEPDGVAGAGTWAQLEPYLVPPDHRSVTEVTGDDLQALPALEAFRRAFRDHLPEGFELGLGFKQKGGRLTEELALLVLVPEKKPLSELADESVVPQTWTHGDVVLKTDVVQSNPTPAALVYDETYHSTLEGGIQISAPNKGVGTLGCVVQDRGDGHRMFLTCNHVAGLGDMVHQPNADPAAMIGTVTRAVPLTTPPNLDCSAIEPSGPPSDPPTFPLPIPPTIPLPIPLPNPLPNPLPFPLPIPSPTPTPSRTIRPSVADLGAVTGQGGGVRVGDPVKKRGRSTGPTGGLVAGIVPWPDSPATSHFLIVSENMGVFCWDGDSGSVILNSRNEVVALLYSKDLDVADSTNEPIIAGARARPIQEVLDALGVEICVSPPVITSLTPDSWAGLLASGGAVTVDGYGFDEGSTVKVGDTDASFVHFQSPRRLLLVPPPGTVGDVTVTNSHGEASKPSPFAYQ